MATFIPLEHCLLGVSLPLNGSLSVLSNSGYGGFFANHCGQFMKKGHDVYGENGGFK